MIDEMLPNLLLSFQSQITEQNVQNIQRAAIAKHKTKDT